MHPADLIQLVGPWKERVQAGDLEENAARAPLVHFWAVVAVRQEALRGPVPSRGDVLCVRLTIETPRRRRTFINVNVWRGMVGKYLLRERKKRPPAEFLRDLDVGTSHTPILLIKVSLTIRCKDCTGFSKFGSESPYTACGIRAVCTCKLSSNTSS